jgi:hypothetical protein
MDKLCRYLDKELEEMENKVGMGGKLSRTEIEDGKNLAKFKMALLTNEAMEEDGYSNEYSGARSYNRGRSRGESMRGNSYEYEDGMSNGRGRGSNAKRDRMGRYSSEDGYSRADAKEEFLEKVYDLMDEAPDEHTRKKFERFVNEMR